MKLPESWNKESSHRTASFNTLTLTGLSLLWGVMLDLINPWFSIFAVICLLAGYGNEIVKRKGDTING